VNSANQNVSLGRIVHFVLRDGLHHRPAIVVETWGNREPVDGACYVNLQVFTDQHNDGWPEGTLWETSVPYSAEPKPRTWHWPERD